MRRRAAVFLVSVLTFAVAACGAAERPTAKKTPEPRPTQAAVTEEMSLTCGSDSVSVGHLPAGVEWAGTFGRVKSLREQLEVHGARWRHNDEELLIGVVCGVRSAERFATLVSRSSLRAYHGKPALRWRTRGGLSNFMWMERPGTAVYIGATPGLAKQIEKVAAKIR
ncbi:hypothetical protein [Nonomuraea rhizosphaerae]|uniref:hypothetical protein n=1 Tax=Nonomuraea rhizosphaerae TaxID=2665663 RepID=UPI001C5F4389|nr:hypothetical protein [Nonomuraea rhizosphaerae]